MCKSKSGYFWSIKSDVIEIGHTEVSEVRLTKLYILAVWRLQGNNNLYNNINNFGEVFSICVLSYNTRE